MMFLEEICLLANRVNVLLKRARKHYKEISKTYANLPLKSIDDLAFNKYDIYKLNNELDDNYINNLVNQIVYKILYQELLNDYDAIKAYVISLLREQNVPSVEDNVDYEYRKDEVEDDEIEELSKRLAYNQVVDATSEKEIEVGLKNQGDVIKDYTEHRIDMLEKRLNEQERLLREKDRQFALLERETRQKQIQEDVDALVKKNLEMFKQIDYAEDPNRDKEALSRRLHQVYMDYINGIEDKYKYKEVKDEEN